MNRKLKSFFLVVMLLSLFGSSVVMAEPEIDVNAIHERALEIVKYYQDGGYKAAYHNMEPVYVPNYGDDGEITEQDGYAVVVGDYEEGKLISKIYLDDKLELKSEGMAVYKYEYDDDGRLVQESYFDRYGQLVNGESKYAWAEYEYTDEGESSLAWYYDASGIVIAGNGYLHQYIQSLKEKDVTVFISAKDEASYGMDQIIIDDMHNLGIKTNLLGKYRYSFYVVAASQSVVEDVSEGSLEYSGLIGEIKFIVKSAGMEAGNYASIVIDGNEYSKNARGLNIVVYDNESKSVIDSFAVDTHLSEMPIFR